MREKILLTGGTNVGKTRALIHLAVLYPESKVFIFDPDDKAQDLIDDMGLELPNLGVIPVTPDWGGFSSSYKMIKKLLKEGDWCCFDMLGRFWDLAQNYYSNQVFGESPAEHIIALKHEAKKASFGGFDGLTDWTVIKRLHNEDILDDAVLWTPFNVAATTSLGEYSAREKLPKTGVEGLIAQEFNGAKPEGEKHNKYRFNTIVILYQRLDGAFCFKIVKHKGKPASLPLREFNISGRTFWEGYREFLA